MSKNFLNGIETTSLDVSGPSITSNGSNILGIVDNGGSRYVGVNNTPLVAPGTEGPTIFPLGTTNLDLNIQSAGTGNVNINGYEAATSENTLAFTNKNLTDPSNTFPTLNQNTTGNAGTATKLATARTIAGVSFDGSADISLNNNAITNGAGYITGYTETDPVYLASEAANITATDITNLGNLSGINTGDQTTITGNAGSATVLATARTLRTNLASTSTASFDGSANATPGVTGTLGVANGGSGRATATTAYGIIAAGTTATAAQQTISPGTSGYFLKSAGASALAAFAAIGESDVTNLVSDLAAKAPLASPTFTGTVTLPTGTVFPSGMAVQEVDSITSAVATGTTLIPFDDTIPQNTEGDQYMSVSITPKASTNKLVIQVLFLASSSIANSIICALFQDSTANALAASMQYQATGTAITEVSLTHTMTAGTTSATTFKVRGGQQSSGGTMTFNGTNGARRFGGVTLSSIIVTEYKI